jgi:hypothetical protein
VLLPLGAGRLALFIIAWCAVGEEYGHQQTHHHGRPRNPGLVQRCGESGDDERKQDVQLRQTEAYHDHVATR